MIELFFRKVLEFRIIVLVVGALGIGITGSFLPSLTRDTSADAFIAADNPALVYRDQVREIFGLADPIIIAVFQEGEHGVFTPEGLQLVESLTLSVQNLPNIDPDRVVSLATENNIEGLSDGMNVESFYDTYPDDLETAQAIWRSVEDFPLYLGSLVARDGSATLIVAEVLDEEKAEETYLAVAELSETTQLPDGVTLHVAGEASVNGYLGMYIARDAQRLNPFAGLVITIIMFLAFRTFAAAAIPGLIIIATVMGALGIMASQGVPFFVISNAIPVVLIGIAVADSIHIFSSYYEALATRPGIQNSDAVVVAMMDMWRPITLTSLTTIAGFAGLAISSVQPPMYYLGVYTALGVSIAWIYSLTVLPAVMSYLKGKRSKVFDRVTNGDSARRLMLGIGNIVIKKPGLIVSLGAVLMFAGIIGASRIEVNDRRIEVFNEEELIYQADQMINAHFDGTGVFDILVETDEPEALFRPRFLKKIEAFQRVIESHGIVGGTTSVVDYLKQMNRSLNEGNSEEYRLIDDEQLNAQLFLLYSTTGDPTDLEEEIDYDYQRANIRVNLKSPSYQELKPVIASLNEYIEAEFNEPGLKATLSGAAMVFYEMTDSVGKSHFNSVLISLILVLFMATIVFRSVVAGLMSLTPVAISILFVYAVMANFGISIGIGTSMFASISIGLGVDFAIHTIDRVRDLYKNSSDDDYVMLALFPSTGRALFFNLLALACGFGVLITSEVVPLMRFGAIVALSVSTAFFFSLTFLPALILVLKPRFVYGNTSSVPVPGSAVATIVFAALVGLAIPVSDATAEDLSGREVMENVVARDDGEYLSRTLKMTLTNRRGKTRVRETRGFRKYFGEEKRTVLFYVSPANVKGTAFLTWDYADEKIDDDQWLYLPATRKIRRVSAADRGDSFLGTDFSFEDVKNEAKPNLSDYEYRRLGVSTVDGVECIIVEGIPVSEKIARELGYSKVESYVDPEIWISRKTEFWDIKGNPLKVIESKDIRQIDGIWTTHEIYAKNYKTGHKTQFSFSDIDYRTPIDDYWFETRRLVRGL